MILDVTAQLVDTIGAENVTTTLIAEHARISVGSIYSYYKDRGAIFDAIVTRSIERQDEIIAVTREQYQHLPFLDTSFHVIDAIANLYRTEPAFRALWFSQFMSSEMIAEMRRSDEENARILLDRMRSTHSAHLDCADPLTAARLYVGLIDVGLGLAFRLDPDGDRRMIDETKAAAGAYLRMYMRPLPDAAMTASAQRPTTKAASRPTTNGTASRPTRTPARTAGSRSATQSKGRR